MNNYQHITAPLRLFHGVDSLKHLGRELDRAGSRRAVVVCGRSLAAHPTALSLVRDAIGERYAGVFDGVRAHSPLPTVQIAAEMLAQLQADAVIAVGGGSAIVTARAAAILLAEGPDPRQLSTRKGADDRLLSPKLSAPKLPQFVVPTTPTTAAVKTGSAVFDPKDGSRLAMFDPKTRAQALFVHPALLATAPQDLVVSASLNTLAMALEGLESATGNPLSDADLMHALRLIRQHLPLALGADEVAARGALVVAAMLCGRGTDTAGGGIVSVLAHAIGARFHVDNGIANAILLPHTMRFNAPATLANANKIAEALGHPADGQPEAAVNAVVSLLERLPLPRTLREVGVTREDFSTIAEHAMGDWFLQKNPRVVTSNAELTELLDQAW
jgi:alcohol dehydrogenase class IV